MIKTSLDLLGSCSAIFGNLQLSSETALKSSGNARKRLSGLWTNFGKTSDNSKKPKTTASKYHPERPKNSRGASPSSERIANSLRRRACARNVSFRISLRWLIHIINSVDKTKLSYSYYNFNPCGIFEKMTAFLSNFQLRIGTRKINGSAKFSELEVQKTRVVMLVID